MRKSFLFICLMLAFAFSNTLPVAACWMAPEPFEIISEDGSRIFVFTPDEYGSADAYAAVYEIIDNERQIVYKVEGLASFAYEGNFYFSSDMTHFVRTFPAPGTPVFEAFANGVRTRVVMRSDFIEDYTSEEGLTSIGPSYTVNWRIEEHSPQNGTITISTDEGNAVIFDLATARFDSENALPVRFEAPSGGSPVPIPQPLNSPIANFVIAVAVAAFIL
ncbi:MAG: hypothetical protein FWE00_11860 [Defluviitaleaceae bacterium]|nr:hypothetical protein [Defluviitaleaceae bacterium]